MRKTKLRRRRQRRRRQRRRHAAAVARPTIEEGLIEPATSFNFKDNGLLKIMYNEAFHQSCLEESFEMNIGGNIPAHLGLVRMGGRSVPISVPSVLQRKEICTNCTVLSPYTITRPSGWYNNIPWYNVSEEKRQQASSPPPRQYSIMINGSELTCVSPAQLHKLSMRLMKGTAQTTKCLPNPATEGNSLSETLTGESQPHANQANYRQRASTDMDKDSISSIGGQSPVVIKRMRTEESLQQLADSVHPKQRSLMECTSPFYVGQHPLAGPGVKPVDILPKESIIANDFWIDHEMNQKKKTSFQPTEEVCPTMINEREFSIKPPLECNMTKLAESPKMQTHDKIVVMAKPPDRRLPNDSSPKSLLGQFLMPPAETAYRGCSGPLLTGTASKVAVVGVSVNQGEHGGLCLASLLASTPGLRPWSRDVRGHYRSCRHSSESCLSRKFTPCVVKCDKLLQTVLCAI